MSLGNATGDENPEPNSRPVKAEMPVVPSEWLHRELLRQTESLVDHLDLGTLAGACKPNADGGPSRREFLGIVDQVEDRAPQQLRIDFREKRSRNDIELQGLPG